MKANYLLTGAFLLFAAAAQAQVPKFNTGKKMNGVLEQLVSNGTNVVVNKEGKHILTKQASDAPVAVIISASDAKSVADKIEAEGYVSTVISNTLLTASVPAAYLTQLAADENVLYINPTRVLKPTMDNTRKVTGVDSVHQGKDLETPFKGAGVLVAVIDQGFEYKHIAFNDADGKTRIKQLWNRTNYYTNPNATVPTENIPSGGDGMAANGHATHVTNTAAGSDVGNGLYGNAPLADLYLIPSSFMDGELVEDVKKIKEFAKSKNMPYVINMSFGSQLGPHDGSQPTDQAINNFLKEGKGFVCAAMGNEGDLAIHATHTFTSDGETKSVLVKTPNKNMGAYSQIMGQLWAQNTDGTKHITFKPFYFLKGKKTYITSAQLKQMQNAGFAVFSDEVNPYNGKHHFDFRLVVESMGRLLGATGAEFGVEMEGNNGDVVHGWLNDGYGTFKRPAGAVAEFINPDHDYLVGEGAASIPHAFGVAAFAATNKYKSAINNQTYTQGGQDVGDITFFSSPGPWLGPIDKPTIAAPGFLVKSAISQYDKAFSSTDYSIVDIQRRGLKKYYYGQMSGTSMASPAATGIVALWLSANPDLTYDQMIEIFKETANHDRYAKPGWNKKFGYGKINAYKGLKKALQIKTGVGVLDIPTNSTTPISISMQPDAWQLLFNNNETYANIAVYTIDGKQVLRRTLNDVRCGQEETINLNELNAGVYILRVDTSNANITRKISVR